MNVRRPGLWSIPRKPEAPAARELDGVAGVVVWDRLLGRNNAQWLPLQSLLQLICAYKVYSRALDFREQFYFVQKQQRIRQLKPIQAGMLVMISSAFVSGGAGRADAV